MARILVTVMLKPEILDPQGAAVRNALGRLGLTGVEKGNPDAVLDGDLDADRDALLHKLAAELLANPVIEDYRLEVDAQATA